MTHQDSVGTQPSKICLGDRLTGERQCPVTAQPLRAGSHATPTPCGRGMTTQAHTPSVLKSLECHSHYSPTARLTGVRAHPTSACPCIRTQVLAWEGTRQHVVAPRPSADRPVRPTLPLR